jgi:tagaturonate epimerase
MGKRFTDALEANEEGVGRNVTENLFDRQLLPIFA